jgi:hypothetical protein
MKLQHPDSIGITANNHSVKGAAVRDFCPAVRRHNRRHADLRRDRGKLDIASLDIAARLLAEGVPASDIYIVAAQVERCIPFVGAAGDDIRSMHVHPWTAELIERYGDKLCTLLMTTRGKVDPR